MNVLIISTSDSGGAGIAAKRLHHGLLSLGVDCNFLCLFAKNPSDKAVFQFPSQRANILERVLRKIGLPWNKQTRIQQEIKKKSGAYEIFSLPISEYDLTKHPLVKNADVIHLHWVANFLDYPSFFKDVNKPIVWTLHDMNPFQGGFHYRQDVERNKASFDYLETYFRQIKQKALDYCQNMHIVTPSRWLKMESENSELLGRFPHSHVFNGLDNQMFKPYPRDFARTVFNLPLDKKILLFVSDNIFNPRKGLDLLLAAIKKLGSEILVCAVGYVDQTFDNQRIVQLGSFQDERLMPLVYSAVDALLLPSREDNLPNVMIEAMACGTPVIGFPIGGLAEVIEPSLTGVLARDTSSESLRHAILEFFDHYSQYNRDKICAIAKNNFTQIGQASKYIEIYQHLLIK